MAKKITVLTNNKRVFKQRIRIISLQKLAGK